MTHDANADNHVYVAWQHDHVDKYILGVFRDKAKAEALVAEGEWREVFVYDVETGEQVESDD